MAALALAAKGAEVMRTATGQWGPCANVTQEVPLDPEKGTQEAPSDPVEETREAPSDREDEAQRTPSAPEEETLKAPSGPEEGTLEAPSDPEEETREGPSDHEEEAKHAAGPTELEGPVIPARRKLTICEIFRQIMSRHTWSRRVHAGVEGAAPQSYLPTNEKGDEEGMSMCDGGGTMIFERKVGLPKPIARGMSPEQ